MRYSFHGKVRASGQQVDGFVEAATATEAIDRLADRGIIGVYSVRPEPKPVKNAVRLSGEAEPPDEDASRQQRLPRLPAVVPKRIATAALKPAPAPAPLPPAGESPKPATAATEEVLVQMVEKLTVLMTRVETALSRSANSMYKAGPVRGSGFSPIKRSGKIPQDVQTNTLHDIFQNNLDLRKSLDTLATTVGQPPVKEPAAPGVKKIPAGAKAASASSSPNISISTADQSTMPDAPAPAAPSAGSVQAVIAIPVPHRDSPAPRDTGRETGRESLKPARDGVRDPSAPAQKLPAQAQPA